MVQVELMISHRSNAVVTFLPILSKTLSILFCLARGMEKFTFDLEKMLHQRTAQMFIVGQLSKFQLFVPKLKSKFLCMYHLSGLSDRI